VRAKHLACLLVVAGCSSPTPAPAPAVPTFATTPGSTTTAVRPAKLPGDCGSLITSQQLDLALGQPLVGRVRGIIGVPEPRINRLERLTCQYGLPENAPPPGRPQPVPVEISVSRYSDEASAARRVDDTIESERAQGAAPSSVPVGPVTGTVLLRKDRRTLVAYSGTVTLAINIAPGLADDRVADVLTDLGGRVFTALG
jgi:hypothetical protein